MCLIIATKFVLVLLASASVLLLAIAQSADKPILSKTRYDYDLATTWVYNYLSFTTWNQPCIKSTSTGPKCRILFVDDFYYHNKYVNATCLEDNVFLIKREDRQITRTRKRLFK